jgi:hypothetical protein
MEQTIKIDDAYENTQWIKSDEIILFLRNKFINGILVGRYVMTANINGTNIRQLASYNQLFSQVSPDGRYIAYINIFDNLILSSFETKQEHLLVENIAPKKEKNCTSNIVNVFQWSPDSKHILVQSAEEDTDKDGILSYFDKASLYLINVPSGKILARFTKKNHSPFFWIKNRHAIINGPFDEDGTCSYLDLANQSEWLVQFGFQNKTMIPTISKDDFHINQTISFVCHEKSQCSETGFILIVNNNSIFLEAQGKSVPLIAGNTNTRFYSPCWSKDGKYAAFSTSDYIYLYDMHYHKLGKVCKGMPSLLFYHQSYVPPAQNFSSLTSIFDMAYRTY